MAHADLATKELHRRPHLWQKVDSRIAHVCNRVHKNCTWTTNSVTFLKRENPRKPNVYAGFKMVAGALPKEDPQAA